jgi:transitional endoplasmic reticulum ATPase
MHPYERWTIRRYLANALKSTRLARPPSADRELFPWIDRHSRFTIWITNDVDRLGPAIIRRMSLALRFPKPTLSVRKTMVAEIAKSADFRLTKTTLLELARTPAPPALIDNAIFCATHIRGSASDAQEILSSSLRALGRREAPTEPASIPFDPTLSSADVDLAQLADQVARSPARALSFCLSGPPGAGKSAYARHLAGRLDLDVLEKRFSDLTSMWLGESEKAIAAAFEEAADLRAFLIIDDADSLLRDRLAAQHSWEITQVNEMLTQMERHPYPYACTTNAPELLDVAAARRFLFKVRFLPMTADQSQRRSGARSAPIPEVRAQTERSDAGRFRDSGKESERARRARFKDVGSMA